MRAMFIAHLDETTLTLRYYVDMKQQQHRVTLERTNVRAVQHPHAFVREHFRILQARHGVKGPLTDAAGEFSHLVSQLTVNEDVLEARLMHKAP